MTKINISDDLSNDDFDLIPFFVTSLVHITSSGNFTQFLTYEYYDETSNYSKKIRSDNLFYTNELNLLANNMQQIQDNCVNKVNNKYVNPKVIDVEIDFKSDKIPFYYWIIQFHAEFKQGKISYESLFEEEEIDYDINSTYIIEKPLKIIEVDSALTFEVEKEKGIIKYWGLKGDWLGPRELIVLELK